MRYKPTPKTPGGYDVDPVDNHVGDRIRQRRAMLGMTQEKLAKDVGVSFQQIQKYERGDNRVSASRLYDIASALRVGITYFFQNMDAETLRIRRAVLPDSKPPEDDNDPLTKPETLLLIRSYWSLPPDSRKHALGLLEAMTKPDASSRSSEEESEE